MKHILTHYITFVFAALSAILLGDAHAQRGTDYTTTPVVIMTPNPSPFLSDWQSQRECIRLSVALTQPMNRPVKLMAQVSLNNQVVARTKPEKMPVISLHQGVNSFVAADIIPLQAVGFSGEIDQASQRAGRLPEGQYEICIWLVNAENGMPVIAAPCQPFTIQTINPVTLILPLNGASFSGQKVLAPLGNNNLNGLEGRNLSDFYDLKIDENGRANISYSTDRELPQVTLAQLAALDKKATDSLKGFKFITGNTQTPFIRLQNNAGQRFTITGNGNQQVDRFVQPVISGNSPSVNQPIGSLNFQWLPPIPASSLPVHYRIRIVPVLPGQTAQQAMLTATPSFEQDDISGNVMAGDFFVRQHYIDFLSKETEEFAWTVQAHDPSGNPVGGNNGWAIPNTFTILGTTTSDQDIPRSFFDIFTEIEIPNVHNNTIDVKPEPCGYTYKEKLQKIFGPWKLFKSYSQYANTYKRQIYRIYKIFTCSLWKGHRGPHHGTAVTVYVKEGEEKVTQAEKPADGPTTGIEPPQYLGDDPPVKQQMDKKDIDKVPTKEEADKKEADEKKANGANDNGNGGGGNGDGKNGSGNSGGTKGGASDGINKDENGGVAPGGKTEEPKAPCPEIKKTLLRTVIGSWKKVSTVIRHAAYRKTVMAWADVTWQRDIWNVYLIQHCTLEKGHGGPHKWDAGHEEWSKYGTVTEKVTYGVGVPESEPKDHWSDSIPHEDPPRNAIFMK